MHMEHLSVPESKEVLRNKINASKRHRSSQSPKLQQFESEIKCISIALCLTVSCASQMKTYVYFIKTKAVNPCSQPGSPETRLVL